MEAVKKLLERPGYRYLLIGGTVYIFELVVIYLAQKWGSSAVFAVGLSFWLGLILSFILQKLVTFRDHRVHHKILLPQILAFSVLVLINFGFTLLVTDILSPPLPATVSRTIALGITVIWNYYIYKTRIFNKMSGK